MSTYNLTSLEGPYELRYLFFRSQKLSRLFVKILGHLAYTRPETRVCGIYILPSLLKEKCDNFKTWCWGLLEICLCIFLINLRCNRWCFETKMKLTAGTRNWIYFSVYFSGALVSTLEYTFPSKGGGGMSLHIDRLAAVNKEKDEFSLYRIKTSNLLRYNHLHGNCMPQR